MENHHDTAQVTPRFFFLSLGMLAALVASFVSFLDLAFDALNSRFPDMLAGGAFSGYDPYQFDGMRTAVAVLVIIFPAFLVLAFCWTRAVKAALSRGDATLKKWTLYLVFVLAVTVGIVNLVTLVRYFLSGEITVRFVLKVAVTLVAAGLVKVYAYRELSRSQMPKGFRAGVAVASAVLVAAAIAFGFSVMGSPAMQRDLRSDGTRVDDLASIQSEVGQYWQSHGALPATLGDLAQSDPTFTLPLDPNGSAYEYSAISPTTFELCATFARAAPTQGYAYETAPLARHAAGRACSDYAMSPPASPSKVGDTAQPVPQSIH